MKHNTHKKLLAGLGLGFGVLLLTGCTANFCSYEDMASMAYPYEQGVTVYLTKSEYEQIKASKNEEGTPTEGAYAIELEEKWSAEATALGINMPTIAGQALEGNPDIYKYIPLNYSFKTIASSSSESSSAGPEKKQFVFDGFGALKVDDLNTAYANAKTSGYFTPSIYYFGLMDDYALKASLIEFYQPGSYVSSTDFATWAAKTETNKVIGIEKELTPAQFIAEIVATNASESDKKLALNPYNAYDTDGKEVNDLGWTEGKAVEQIPAELSILRKEGRIKFSGAKKEDGTRELWENIDAWREAIRKNYASIDTPISQLDTYAVADETFHNLYKTTINNRVSSIRSCITTREGYYGHYGANADWRVEITQKDWGYAWKRGFLEGLLVYPVSWLTDTFAYGMDPALTGVGQIWAIIFVTLIVRGLLMLVSFRSTLDSAKMQNIQPELQKLQARYPNSNTNQAEKAKLSQEQMALYRRHGIKPFRQIFVLILQFPLFICVWSGLQGSAALSTGEFLNLSLSDTIQQTLFNVKGTWYANTYGWWTALVLFLLMAGTQIMAMLLPRLIQKARTKKIGQMNKVPAQDSQNKTMKWVSIFMMGFTIFMGFMLPSAMGVYWLIGGLLSMAQTAISQLVLAKSGRKK